MTDKEREKAARFAALLRERADLLYYSLVRNNCADQQLAQVLDSGIWDLQIWVNQLKEIAKQQQL